MQGNSCSIYNIISFVCYHVFCCWINNWTPKSWKHDDVIKWKHLPRYWSFVSGIHRSPKNSSHKGQWCRVMMFSLICAWIKVWVNYCEAGDLRRYRTRYDITVMWCWHVWRASCITGLCAGYPPTAVIWLTQWNNHAYYGSMNSKITLKTINTIKPKLKLNRTVYIRYKQLTLRHKVSL